MEIDLRRQSLAIPIREAHDVGDARRQAMRAGKAVGFDETANGRVGIVATELAGNLVKHAGGGTLVLRVLAAGDTQSPERFDETIQGPDILGLEILSLDDGPGMNVQRCMEDGYSTAGSSGTGLGAISRQATSFEIYSVPDKGTVMAARLWPRTAPRADYDVGAVCLPIAGERLCGDAWAVRLSSSGLDVVVSDGLGHGPIAAEASDAALEVFARRPDLAPGPLLETMHAAMRATRGAAVLTGHLDGTGNRLTCAGTGNIAGYIMASPRPRGIVSMNGIVGHQIHKVKVFDYECAPEDVIILHSDGLTTHWKLDDFPGLTSRSASLIAGTLFKHFKRGKDDATVVVVRRL